jgi:hypothetical protein
MVRGLTVVLLATSFVSTSLGRRAFRALPTSIEVQSVKADPYRDTRGPGRAGFRDMLDSLAKRKDPKSMRDRAIPLEN